MKKFLGVFSVMMAAALFYPSAGFATEASSTSSGGGSTAEPTKTDGMQALTINVPGDTVKITLPGSFEAHPIFRSVGLSGPPGHLNFRVGDASQAPAPQK